MTSEPTKPKPWTELPKRAWITGAGKGIGRALALRLARDGWSVYASSRTLADLETLAQEAETASGSVEPCPLDVSDIDAAKALVARITEDGPIGLAVLNAGTHTPTPAKNFDLAAASHLIDVNVKGTLNCLAPVMAAMRIEKLGKIAIVASVAGYKGLPEASAYCASKAGLIGLAESLHPELREEGVGLSVVNPGFVKTPLTDKNDFPMPFLMDVDDAVSRIVSGLESDRFEVAFPTRFVLILKVLRLLPDWLYFKITGKMVR